MIVFSFFVFDQTAHLQSEQLQSVHEHAEPQLVFSSTKKERSEIYGLIFYEYIREHDLQSHLHKSP